MMQFLWVQYALLAVTLAACLALSLSLKKEIDEVRRYSRDAVAASAAAVAAEMAAFKQESGEAPLMTGQDLNLTRRAQAIRMQRRGESAATIAAALRVPRNEIDLLLKIQKLANCHEHETAAAASERPATN
jgi:hypothetical protein